MANPIETVLSIVTGASSAPGMMTQIEAVLARRPVWIAQLAARELAHGARATAPLWRFVRVPGPMSTIAMRGTSMVATTAGATGLATTLGIPIAVAVGSWVMLGSGYYRARQEIKAKGFMRGFAQGFTAGVLKWEWGHVYNILFIKNIVRTNVWDGVMDREEALGYNKGLHMGFAAGEGAEKTFIYDPRGATRETIPVGKNYRIALRKLAGITAAGDWSRNDDEKRLQQRNYVIELASAGLKHGLIVPE
jgi:hypothetical protein